jgi:DNA-binding MarR family transcriptional regulator
MNEIDMALTALRRVIRAIDLHSKQLVKTASVTGPQLRLLQLIQKNPGASIKQLAQEMSLSQATVTTIIDRLEDREILSRLRSQSDKRKVHLILTAKGESILLKAPAVLQDAFVERFEQLADWEKHMIIASIQRVAEMMDASEIDASPFLEVESLDRDV